MEKTCVASISDVRWANAVQRSHTGVTFKLICSSIDVGVIATFEWKNPRCHLSGLAAISLGISRHMEHSKAYVTVEMLAVYPLEPQSYNYYAHTRVALS